MVYFSNILIEALLQNCAKEYIELLAQLKDKGYIIIAAVCDTIGFFCDSILDEKWKLLGFSETFFKKIWRGYIGVLDNGQVIFERMGELDESVKWEGQISNQKIIVESSPFWNKNMVSIHFDDVDYAEHGRGINIVIYDKNLNCIVDSVSFDVCLEGLPLKHRDLKLPDSLYQWLYRQKIKKRMDEIGGINNNKIKASTGNIVDQRYEYRQRLRLEKLFPEKFRSCIKVRLVTAETAYAWNTVKSLLSSFITDSRFHVASIFVNNIFFDQTKNLTKETGIDCLRWMEYNIAEDRPDIIILALANILAPEYRHIYWLCGNFSKLFFALPYTLTGHYDESFSSRIASIAIRLQRFGLDYCFWDSLIYKKLKSDGYDISHCVEMGNPKFDAIYSKLNKLNSFPKNWEKVRGKIVFLWATDHEWMSNNCTFDQYAEIVFRYFYNFSDAALIFRPHPYYINELKEVGVWTQQEIDQLKLYFSQSPNMIWDEDPDYSLAYDTANAIITDVECGITVSALSTKKPLCVFFRMGVPKHIEFPELIDNLYQVQSEQECIAFFEMIQRGEDPMKEQREQAFHNCICHFDGKNGQRMKDFIAEKYFEKYGTPENQE